MAGMTYLNFQISSLSGILSSLSLSSGDSSRQKGVTGMVGMTYHNFHFFLSLSGVPPSLAADNGGSSPPKGVTGMMGMTYRIFNLPIYSWL